MMKFNLKKIKNFLSIFLIISIFIFISYLVQTNMSYFKNNLDSGIFGILIYIFLIIISIVIAPISTIPVLPIAILLFGWIQAGIYLIIGWTLGSIIAFILAKKYGINLIQKFIKIKKYQEYEKYIPKKNLFLNIIILRTLIPVDILSYFLGLFSKVDLKTYSLATLIGELVLSHLF